MLIIKIVNDGTGDKINGSYNYEAYINNTLIESGYVKQHKRAWGWKALLRKMSKVPREDISYNRSWDIQGLVNYNADHEEIKCQS